MDELERNPWDDAEGGDAALSMEPAGGTSDTDVEDAVPVHDDGVSSGGRDVASREVAGQDVVGQDVAGQDVVGQDVGDRDVGDRDVAGQDVAPADAAGSGTQGGPGSDGPGVAAPEREGAPGSGAPVPAGSRPAPMQQTGDARVDEALARLAGLDELPLAAQVTVFDDVHRLLQDALTASDASPSPGTPAR